MAKRRITATSIIEQLRGISCEYESINNEIIKKYKYSFLLEEIASANAKKLGKSLAFQLEDRIKDLLINIDHIIRDTLEGIE